MNKSTNFSGTSVFGQLFSLIPSQIISNAIQKTGADYKVKKFSPFDHFVTMLYGVSTHTTSIRELISTVLGLEGKISHLKLSHLPKRSTLSDANKNRSVEMFEEIYYSLVNTYKGVLSDSKFVKEYGKELCIIDSTTISLYDDVLKTIGRKPKDGKCKGGIKLHTLIRADYNTPIFIEMTDARVHDSNFLENVIFEKDKIYVFDKGYNDYERFEWFIKNEIPFVTRIKHNAKAMKVSENELLEGTSENVLIDEIIKIPITIQGKVERYVEMRKVAYWDEEKAVCYELISNINDLKPEQVVQIYKHRWIVENMNKYIKQNIQLDYFLGDNENAIKIQIWCSLIWYLLLVVLHRRLRKNISIAFSVMTKFVDVFIISYVNVVNFLLDPYKYHKQSVVNEEPNLFKDIGLL